EEFLKKLTLLQHDKPLVLIFDQFEEFVTLAEDQQKSRGSEAARAAQTRLLDLLAKLLRDQKLPIKLLFVFREDYLAKLNPLFQICPDLIDNYLRVTPLSTTVINRIIRGPFEAISVEHWKKELSPSLAGLIAEEVSRGDGTVNLSEVQIVCLQLWNAANPEDLFRRRHVAGILKDFLTDAVSLMKELQDPATSF